MSDRSKLSRLSRLELVELIYDIRKDNLALEKQCRKLEKQLGALQEREMYGKGESGLDERLSEIEKEN